jgi:large subunit ribosomal protein L24
LSGQIGAVRVNASATATGKRDAFVLTDLGALAGTDVRLEGELDADEAAPLLALLGLDRAVAADSKHARLQIAANGPLNREIRFDGKLNAGPIDLNGVGALRLATGQPASLDLTQIAGTVGGNKMQGRLTVGLGEAGRVEGSIETERLDVPAVVAAAIGGASRSGTNGSGWSSEPIAWHPPGIGGHIAFKAQRAMLLPGVVAQDVHGQARFSRSEVVFENIAGEIGKGRLEGRLAIANGDSGITARLGVGLTDAAAGALFPEAERPPVTGRLTLQTEIEGAGRSPAAFIGSLTGYGNLTLDQGHLAGLNPEVFGAVTRAVELGIPVEGARIREFVGGALDNAGLPVSKVSATISISAGQARLRDIAIKSDRADLQATARVDLADGTLDALLTLNGLAAAPGAVRPAVLIALKGPFDAPKRSIDTGLLTSWLTLRAVEQQSRQIDAMEQARRDAAAAPRPQPDPPAPPATFAPMSITPDTPAPNAAAPDSRTSSAAGEQSGSSQAPALPPPVTIPLTPKPRTLPHAGNSPSPAMPRPPGLIGAQN